MTILRVFPRRTKATPTDELAFVGGPPQDLYRPDPRGVSEVHISVAFTQDKTESLRLSDLWARAYPTARIVHGGPAWGDGGGDFTPGLYLKRGYVITSRGCPNRCRFCLVPEREGGIRELSITDGHDVLDNNLLACSDRHIEGVLAMLRHQKARARFSGGLEARHLTPTRIEQLRSLRIDEVFLAYDSDGAWSVVETAIRRLRRAGMYRDQVRCYVLGGYANTDTPQRWADRCEQVLVAGGIPFAMLYQGENRDEGDYPVEWLDVRRKYVRPAAMLSGGRRAELERLGGYV